MRHSLIHVAKILTRLSERGMISSLRIKIVILILRDILRKIILAKLVNLWQKRALRNTA